MQFAIRFVEMIIAFSQKRICFLIGKRVDALAALIGGILRNWSNHPSLLGFCPPECTQSSPALPPNILMLRGFGKPVRMRGNAKKSAKLRKSTKHF